MNQKNSLGLDICFKDLDNPIDLFTEWFEKAKKTEINDPNALSLATSDNKGIPSARMVLLKNFNEQEFTFYTNLNSKKSEDLKQNPNASMCFYWKSLKRQIRISGTVTKVSDEIADEYYSSRSYGSKIGAWASNQSAVLNNRKELFKSIEKFQKKFSDKNNIARPNYWSGWNLKPLEIEFWLQVDDRLHERLKYKKKNEIWNKFLLNP